jgi:glycopeptide antibiotics resistance protein
LFSKDIDFVAYLENILLFIPFGCLLPFIWTDTNNLKCVVLSGFFFSLLIEISQLFNNRRTDIDDLMLNTFGALLGYLLFKLFARVTKRNDKLVNNNKYEFIIYVIAMFFGHFLLFNEFGLAKILYDF